MLSKDLCHPLDLEQGSAKYDLQAKSSSPPDFVNKLSMAVFALQQQLSGGQRLWLVKLKYLLSGLFQTRFVDP